jgi:predicted nucleic acid-binding protein
VQQATDYLADSLRDDAHQFWADSISWPDALAMFTDRIRGHLQITDAYLVALAISH